MNQIPQKLIITLFFIVGFFQGYAQIGINTDDPDTSAILDIDSDDRGVLFPRISNPNQLDSTDGLFFYNNKEERFYYYNASKSNWQCINPFNSTDSSQIAAPGNLEVNSDLTVKNNQTVKNKLTVEEIFNLANVIEANQNEIVLNKGVDVNDTMAVKNKLTVEEGKLSVEKGNLEVKNGNVNVPNGEITGRGTVPLGTIVMWNGDELPNDNWQVCDGTNGTPDLRNKFIQGADDCDDTGNKELIGHPTNIYTTEADSCQPFKTIYTLEKKRMEDANIIKTDTLTRGANSLNTAKSMAGCTTGELLDQEIICREINSKPNENYYLYDDNKENCVKDGYSAFRKYKIVFIQRMQ